MGSRLNVGFRPRREYMSRGSKPPKRSRVAAKPYRSLTTRRGLIDELDRVTSLIVRKRDVVCITCGEGRPELLTCSHFYSRRWLNIRFDLRNTACQCWNCNANIHAVNPWPYTSWFLDTYSTDVMAELFELRNRRETPTTEELKFMLSEYRQMLRGMQ
jgi:hypothetical protein